MVELKNTFLAGKMQKDTDSRLIPEGEYRHGLNIKVTSSQGSDVGAIENVLSNKQLTSVSLGTTVDTVFAYFDPSSDKIYWGTTSETSDNVLEYDTINDTVSVVITDSSLGLLGFDKDHLITGVSVLVDSDNDRRFLMWASELTPPRIINIEEAKLWSPNGFTESMIGFMKSAPLYPPTLSMTNSPTEEENNMEERFLRFSYRYRYRNGEVSSMSPFTETAFLPRSFAYDYATSSNESMINQYNRAVIGFNTGPSDVVGLDILVKESVSSTVYIVQSLDKSKESWSDNSSQSFTFTNNKVQSALADDQLTRLYDAVPTSAKALEMIGNRVVFGNYTEGYNITEQDGTDIKIDFDVDVLSTSVPNGTPATTMKSIRDYEVGIVYLDDVGRMSTVLVSPNNTAYIGNSDCVNQNKLRVTIKNEAPYWATKYRFFLKQTRTDYQTIVPSVFYQDRVYVWIKVEADETNKFKVGDFLYIKGDSSQVLTKAVQVRVLEIEEKEENFLEEEPPEPFEVRQLAGTYFKVKQDGFRLNEDDFQTFENITVGFRSRSGANNFDDDTTYYVETPVYYGTVGLDDLSVSGSYNGSTDIRYRVDINSVGPVDAFRWRDDDGGAWSADIPITGGAQALEKGISVTFGNTTGHDLSDQWILSAKSGDITELWRQDDGGPAGGEGRRAIISYSGKPSTSPTGETIKGGSSITIVYDDTDSDGANPGIQYSQTFTSTRDYAHIEEWFFGDNIIDTLTYPTSMDRILFRRGEQFKDSSPDGYERVRVDPVGDQVIMCFLSNESFNGSERIYVNKFSTPSITILELANNIVFETIPDNVDSNFFYEVGRTYDIVNNYHQGFDGNDTDQTSSVDAVLVLDTFNAFSWGNGFESYKIKDMFNSNMMKTDTRPSGVIEGYRQNKRIADLTYSKPFEQSTNFNGLNEFNLSTGNWMSMDDKYGSIQKLFSAETNLEVYQEDKVHNVLYSKDVLFDADGQGNIRQSSSVLGNAPIPWAGEYGISKNPESFAFYGNMRYWVDTRRGCVIRRSMDGITEITYGLKDFFRDAFRENPTTKKFGGYDLHDKEYVLYDSGEFTVGYSETVKGYPSFYSFSPQWMGSLNNKFYSFSQGQLYEHYDESNPVRNNFYGVDYDSEVILMINQGPSDIKVMKTVSLEGNKPWKAVIKSYLNNETTSVTQSTINLSEYVNKEGKFYGYVRRNELTGDFTAKSIYGLGEVESMAGQVITLSGNIIGTTITVGDQLYDSSNTLLGTITGHDVLNKTVTINASPVVAPGTFVYGVKTGRYEGSEIRGYNFEVKLTDESGSRTELFALNSNVFKSLPS